MSNINPQNPAYIPQAELRAQGLLDNTLNLDGDGTSISGIEFILGELQNGRSPDQLQQAMELFQLTDVTGDGLLDKTELTALQMQIDFDRDGAISPTDAGMFGRLLNIAPQVVQSNIATNHQFLINQVNEPTTSPQVQAMTDATMTLMNGFGGAESPVAQAIYHRVPAFLAQMGVPPQQPIPADDSLTLEQNMSNQITHLLNGAIDHFGGIESSSSQAFIARYHGFLHALSQ